MIACREKELGSSFHLGIGAKLSTRVVDVRERAKAGRQTISGFVLSILTRALDFEESLEVRMFVSPSFRATSRAFFTNRERKVRPRTAIVVRCSTEEAEEIRAGARRTQVMIAD